MADKELDYAAEGFAKSYVASIASGTAEEMEYLANFAKAGYKAGYNAALGGYDPYEEYFEKKKEPVKEVDETFDISVWC